MFAEFHYLGFVWIYIVPKNRKEAAYFSDINNFTKFWENTIYVKTTLEWSEREYSNTISRKLKYNFSFEPRLKLLTTKDLK